MYQKITLYVRSQANHALNEVTTVLVPNFNKKPDIIIWSTRCFKLDELSGKYLEAFTYVAFTEEELKNLGLLHPVREI